MHSALLWPPDSAPHSTPRHPPYHHPRTHPPTPASSPASSHALWLFQVEYTPIEYADQPLVNSFTQFLVRCGRWATGDIAHFAGKQRWLWCSCSPCRTGQRACMDAAGKQAVATGGRGTGGQHAHSHLFRNAMPDVECYTHRPAPHPCVCRVRNVQEQRPIELSNTHLQYWLNGPLEDMPAPSYTLPDPESVFVVQCEWATTGGRWGRHGGSRRCTT